MFTFKTFIVLALTFMSFDAIWVNFCIWCEVEVSHHSVARGSPVAPAPFVEEILSPIE